MNILIADDEKTIRESFIKRIKRLNLNIQNYFEAADGQAAIELCKVHDIAFALVDINMPNLSGLEFLKLLHKQNKGIKTIIISGHQEFSYAAEAMKYGVQRYLLKPINREEFEETVLELYKSCSNVEHDMSKIANTILNHIDDNYKNPDYSLSILASEVQLSEGYITKILKKECNSTFSDYLISQRINCAKKQIENSDGIIKMYEIAESCGFSSQHYFSRAFKKVTGTSPKQWKG